MIQLLPANWGPVLNQTPSFFRSEGLRALCVRKLKALHDSYFDSATLYFTVVLGVSTAAVPTGVTV